MCWTWSRHRWGGSRGHEVGVGKGWNAVGKGHEGRAEVEECLCVYVCVCDRAWGTNPCRKASDACSAAHWTACCWMALLSECNEMCLQQLVGTIFPRLSNLISYSFALSEFGRCLGYLLGTCLAPVTRVTIRNSHVYCVSHSYSNSLNLDLYIT